MDDSLDRLIRAALDEDLGPGDITTTAVVPGGLGGRAEIVAKSPTVVAGLVPARRTFELLDSEIRFRAAVRRGEAVDAGAVIALIEGPVRGILSGERVALNFLGHLSGIAALTREFARALEGTATRLLDTRKTTPGLRALEKNAVRAGGGENHRVGLFDGILVKDNHIVAAGGIGEAVARARRRGRSPGLRIEVEVTTLAEVEEALAAGADMLLLDNMDVAAMKRAVDLARGRALLEASGNVNLATVRAVAATGVDFVSVGAITHSAPSADLSLRLVEVAQAG